MAGVADVYARTGFVTLVSHALQEEGWSPHVRRTWAGAHDRLPEPGENGYGELVVSCHWPILFTAAYLDKHQHGGVNLHPNLSLGYKVDDPVGRALEKGHTLMSVACHRMTQEPDEGEILAEHWRTVPEGSSRTYAYELLRPLYVSVLREALRLL